MTTLTSTWRARARDAGLRAVWRRDPLVSGIVNADAVIEELGDLLTLLGVVPSVAATDSPIEGGKTGAA